MGTRKRRPWRVVIDNSIRMYGDCNHRTRIMRVNVRLHLLDFENITDTLIHEDMHRRFPDKAEEEIVELTTQRKITDRQRRILFDLFETAKEECLKTHKNLWGNGHLRKFHTNFAFPKK